MKVEMVLRGAPGMVIMAVGLTGVLDAFTFLMAALQPRGVGKAIGLRAALSVSPRCSLLLGHLAIAVNPNMAAYLAWSRLRTSCISGRRAVTCLRAQSTVDPERNGTNK
jgi:hypothetical protein